MGIFFVYTLKSSVCLALFYLFYRLLLTKETFHRFNRVFLIGLMLLSMIIPFCQITLSQPQIIQHPTLNWQQLLLLAREIEQEPAQSLAWQLVLILYFIGSFFFLLYTVYSLYQIKRIIRSGERRQIENNRILILTPQKISPFSWMNYVIISYSDFEESGNEILAHEISHIRLRHSWDVCLIGLSTIVYWYNPAIWLLKQELQNIHEYEADESVINQGINAKKYQLLLIKKAVGTQRFTSMANSFNHSKLKKRITMMLKGKSSPWARLKYAYVLPLAAFAIVAFARPEISREFEKISNTKISKISISDPVGAQENQNNHFMYPTSEPDSLEKDGEKMYVSTNVFKFDQLDSLDLSKEDFDFKFQSFQINEKDIQAKIDEAMKNVDFSKLSESDIQAKIDEVMKSIDFEKIALDIEEKTKNLKLDEKVLEKAKKDMELAQKNIEKAMANAFTVQNETMVKFSADGEHPLVLCNGKEIPSESIDKIDPATIESMSVDKNGESAVAKYGVKAKNGVIIIKTK